MNTEDLGIHITRLPSKTPSCPDCGVGRPPARFLYWEHVCKADPRNQLKTATYDNPVPLMTLSTPRELYGKLKFLREAIYDVAFRANELNASDEHMVLVKNHLQSIYQLAVKHEGELINA